MTRPGDLFDQDDQKPVAGPTHAGRGGFFDQEAPAGAANGDWRGEMRRRRDAERQQRELRLRYQLERPSGPGPPAAEDRVRISSRPVPRRGSAPVSRPPEPVPRSKRGGGSGSTSQATAVVAAGTLASRLTGFLRVLVIAYVLGVGSFSDAFNYANGVPNIVYDLLLGGILSATLIPVFVEQLSRDDPEERTRSISAIVTAIGVALIAMSALLWLLAPYVIHFYLLLNPASTAASERALATRLLRYFAPQVFFLGAIVVSTALLNARRRFTVAAFSPVINNLIAIGALLATKAVASQILATKTVTSSTLQRFGHDYRAVLILGIGTTAGYVVQLLVQLPATWRAGFHLRPVWDLHHPAVRQVARLSTWLVGVVLANQASLALVAVLAGRTDGGWTAYQFSYQFFQLPYALVAVSVATAIMPDLAERWTADDRRGFEARFSSGLRVTLAILMPVGAVYAAVAQPFIELALHHGAVHQSGAHLVSSSLALFAVGLPGFATYFLLMRAYQAMQNARAMFWVYALENALTVVAALALDPLIGVAGLALAWIAPYTIASFVAAADLRKRVGSFGGADTVQVLVRVAVASAITLVVVVVIGLAFPSAAQSSDAVLIARLAAQVGAGAVIYYGLARLMRIRDVLTVVGLARRLASARST